MFPIRMGSAACASYTRHGGVIFKGQAGRGGRGRAGGRGPGGSLGRPSLGGIGRVWGVEKWVFYNVFGMILGGRPFLGGSGRGVLGG